MGDFATTTKKPRELSCGCCTGGCCCWMHKPDLRPPHVCDYHKEHPHRHVTEEPAPPALVHYEDGPGGRITLSFGIKVF